MKREEIKALIEGITPEQLDAIMKMNGEDVNHAKAPISELQGKLDAANKQIDEFNAQLQQTQTQEEQLNALRESLQSTQREMTIKSNRIDARSILKEIGLDDESIESQLNLIVVESAEQTQSNAKALASLIEAQRDATRAATEKEMLKGQLEPGGSEATHVTSKEDFNKMSYSEKAQYLKENPEFRSSLQ